MNNVNIVGNLTRDIELKYFETEKGKLASAQFSIGVRRTEDITDFINCKVVGKTAEVINEYTKKGDRLVINGRMQVDTWEKNGERQSMTYVYVNSVVLPERKKEERVEPKLAPEVENTWGKAQDMKIETEDLPFY